MSNVGDTVAAAPVLKYPGAKWRLADWIIAHMPPHRVYVEPYFGSGAVFFVKPPAKLETINDANGHVVTTFVDSELECSNFLQISELVAPNLRVG